VTIEFPKDLVVPNLVEMEESELVPWFERCAFAVNRIQMPVDCVAIVNLLVPQQAKLMGTSRPLTNAPVTNLSA